MNGLLGVTIPRTTSDEDTRTRTHVNVRLCNRSLALHENVPIENLVPVHPAGHGDIVTLIAGEKIGLIGRVHRISFDGECDIRILEQPHTRLEIAAKKCLAVLSTRY